MDRLMNTLVPWSRPGRLWRAACHVNLGLVMGILTFSLTITFLALSFGLLVTFFLALPAIWMLFTLARGLAKIERSRARALMGVDIADPIPPLTRPGWIGRLAERARSGPRWREIAYNLALLPVGVIGYALSTVAWSGSLAMVTMPFVVDHLPGDSAKFYFFELTSGPGTIGAAAVGVAGLLFVAPWVTLAAAKVQASMASGLLGPSTDEVLVQQVSRLETSRTAAVDSAEAERRRIERDLHDGAQQRLVALAAGLGAAREKFDDDPEQARAMVSDAHEEAKAALTEIRDLVRGIHPVILEDRGLDAALSAIVAKSPVPVALDVQIADRPPAAIESAAYFIVNEALTNVARHASATRAYISIARAGDRLVVEIRDNGKGGADPTGGTGLAGMRERVTALGGNMYVISPPGGPTTISVELPCGS
ncbi:MAG TPA: sensor histidine kinase [Ilumatobacteraceae bacterium]|nr:sensor histidine kinase [Ilumatobacteraceae bacterium]